MPKYAPGAPWRPSQTDSSSNATIDRIQKPAFKFPNLPRAHVTYPSEQAEASYGPSVIPLPWSVEVLNYHLDSDTPVAEIENWMLRSGISAYQANAHLRQYIGPSPMFYAVKRDCPDSIHLLAKYGLDPNIAAFEDQIPLLAYAIMSAWFNLQNGTEVVRALLTVGAKAEAIPADMWMNYMKPARRWGKGHPAGQSSKGDASPSLWCRQVYRDILAPGLNLTMRYMLHISANQPRRSLKQLGIATHHGISRLDGLFCHLVGQRHAAQKISDALWTWLNTSEHASPLVFLFAGPAYHGKTELARHLGQVLSAPLFEVKTTKLLQAREAPVLSPDAEYRVREDGASLVHFLRANNGRRSVVFLEGLNQDDYEIHDTMMEALDDSK